MTKYASAVSRQVQCRKINPMPDKLFGFYSTPLALGQPLIAEGYNDAYINHIGAY